jgi:hypothetical protein
VALGAVVLRTSNDHEVAVRVGEGVPVLGRCSVFLWRLLVVVRTLALAGLTQHSLEELAILELVLDRELWLVHDFSRSYSKWSLFPCRLPAWSATVIVLGLG